MTYISNLDRRSFLIGSASAVGGLSVGFNIPFGDEAAAAETTPEVNAWVVIRPDETVVIRIARSEMGQGTLTGLAQLVAEELDCDWSKVTYEFPTPGQNVARKRVWGNFFTAGSQGIRTSIDLVSKGGAAARMMLVQAAADRLEGSGIGVRRGQWRHHAQGFESAHHLRKGGESGCQGRAAKRDQAQGPEGLEDCRQGLKRLDTPDKTQGKTIYGIDIRLPGMLYAAIKAMPCRGRQGEELRCCQDRKPQGRKKSRPG